MKRIISIFLVTLFFASCSPEVGQNVFLEIVPIDSVEMPTDFKVDSITVIPIRYIRPTNCHQFSNFYYNAIGNERTVAIYCTTIDGGNCQPVVNNQAEVPLKFKPVVSGTYTFRFWTGKNEQGVDQYIEHEVIVDN